MAYKLVSMATFPNEIEPDSENWTYTREMITSYPSLGSEWRTNYEYMKMYPYIERWTFGQNLGIFWVTRKVFWGPRRFVALEQDFCNEPITEPYDEASCWLHVEDGRIGRADFVLKPLDGSKDGTRLRVEVEWSPTGNDALNKPFPKYEKWAAASRNTYGLTWVGPLSEKKMERIITFRMPRDLESPIVQMLVMQLARERALKYPGKDAGKAATPTRRSNKTVTVTEKEVACTTGVIQRRRKFSALRSSGSLGVCLLPTSWWQRYKKSRHLGM
ncbi:uncharacterized protein BP01DRAFT_400162 [Aspergillus saccharolyticus JOP 1030-1]|uniref:Uncharacterized protein n=1 Tax=Aspergillus saccharolyticus JOP 1030-1 TaxID=1450539 RepID=A0A318ZAR4_9EURO|nr:hypothetical protein BP01DRAFT_400162 [Aspergillus saccharolyticus JOP 1030-1]PYH44531.1 hypothetical protein BP01DRAFT_400162 [Aspergillus saccharolyticus JOP 1030-1]